MAESSFLWDSGAGGDASPHSESDVAAMFAAMMGGSGVLKGYLNDLVPTVSGSHILMNTGWAFVDGHPYRNSASLDTTITTPSIGTTGHRLVLRADWSAQTVRLVDKASSDGTSSIPAQTQTSGTTYEITICTLTITTGGAITMSDVRAYAPLTDDSRGNATRNDFRLGRHMIAEWAGITFPANIGFGSVSGSPSAAILNGEPYASITGTGTSRMRLYGATALRETVKPRMLARVVFPAASANVTHFNVGFFDTPGTAPSVAACILVVTTGNVFFHTKNGGSATQTDLGALTRTTVFYGIEIETPDSGTTWYCRLTYPAGTTNLVATHTTNVPGSNMDGGFESVIATAGVTHGLAYMFAEVTGG